MNIRAAFRSLRGASPIVAARPQATRSDGAVRTAESDRQDWERALFLHPQLALDAARSGLRGRRIGGLLLAGLAALAVTVGEARAAGPGEATEARIEASDGGVDYLRWLLEMLFGTSSDGDAKIDEGTENDPHGGEE